LLPIQLIPYFQYTALAVIGTLLLAFQCRQMGRQGFYGASIGVDPESLVTPWLIACWMRIVLQGFRRGHRVLMGFYDLCEIRTRQQMSPWEEAQGYFPALDLGPRTPRDHARGLIERLLQRYSRSTARFLFGTPSQFRLRPNLPQRP
jgi:hypothetical protein